MFLIITEQKINNDNICLLNKLIYFYNRVDGYKEYFGLTNSLYFGNGNFLTYWDMNIYHIKYNNMFQNGLQYKVIRYRYWCMVQP